MSASESAPPVTGIQAKRDGHHTPNISISSQSHACNAAFDRLRQSIPNSAYRGLENAVADEVGRFKIWAANIGALQDAKSASSLDSRLKTSDRMRQFVSSDLTRLKDVLDRAGIISGDLPNRTSQPLVSEEDVATRSVEIVFRSDAGNIMGDESSTSDTTELAQLFLNIQSCITHLFTLSTLIRKDRPRGRIGRQRPQDSVPDPGPDIVNARDKFPKLKQRPWLAERIGTWVSKQRDYVRYRQDHRKKMSRSNKDASDETRSTRATTKATTYNDPSSGQEAMNSNSISAREGSFTSVATSFATTAAGDMASGRRIPNLTDMWLDGVKLGYNQNIECPFCRTIQIIENRNQWK
ncbi:uncharacterized protein CTRU02_207537 [Colletotrichum truncatum]|uniref:Uncharacterized protein n=1 Tax=Colletotrichum truncatum TaxID=5467 RepID=A0ACC3Z147_COLTU